MKISKESTAEPAKTWSYFWGHLKLGFHQSYIFKKFESVCSFLDLEDKPLLCMKLKSLTQSVPYSPL